MIVKRIMLGGSEVLSWKPHEVIEDSSLMQLDVDLGFEGMEEEIGNLEKCGAGKVRVRWDCCKGPD